MNYVIITLSEIKKTKGAFAYYIITEGEGVSKMLMGDREGVGLVITDANKFFYKCQVFINLY